MAPRRGHSVTLLLGKVTVVNPPAAPAAPSARRQRVVVDPIIITGHVAAASRELVFAPDRVVHSAPRLVFAPEVVKRSAVPAPSLPAAPATPALPELPTRAAVREVLAESHDLAERCFDRGMVPGPVTLHLDVRGRDGRVERARALPYSTTSKCVERAAARMRFPRFARRTMHVVHRYLFR